MPMLFLIFSCFLWYSRGLILNSSSSLFVNRRLTSSTSLCASEQATSIGYQNYINGMNNIYANDMDAETCYPVHKKCGWPVEPSKLPLFVIAVGLEGAGHHLWSEILGEPVFSEGCTWINARHYQRGLGDGVPRLTSDSLEAGLKEQFAIRKEMGLPPCKAIFDKEDSFPTGAIRKSQRLYMHPG